MGVVKGARIRRRRHNRRHADIARQRHENWCGKNVGFRGSSRRRQGEEWGRRLKEISWRRLWWLEREGRIVQDEHGPLDILKFVRQRRRYIVFHHCEFGRR